MTTTNSLIHVPDEVIMSKIIVIRDKKVMLDRDIAELYGVSTKRLNEQVKRNPKRFPPDFMFQITQDEKEILIQQFEHLNALKFSSTLPFAEHGAVMLSSVLSSEQAIEINIQIVRVYTHIRQYLSDTTAFRLEIEKIKSKLENQSKNIELVFQYLDELMELQSNEIIRPAIGFQHSLARS
jgi:hypothetical protein